MTYWNTLEPPSLDPQSSMDTKNMKWSKYFMLSTFEINYIILSSGRIAQCLIKLGFPPRILNMHQILTRKSIIATPSPCIQQLLKPHTTSLHLCLPLQDIVA